MSIRISFDRSLYLAEAVEAAAAAYAEYAKVELVTEGDTIVAAVSEPVEHELEMVAQSFANHVLYETIARTRQSVPKETV